MIKISKQFSGLVLLSSCVALTSMSLRGDIHDRIEYKISRAQGLLEIVNNEIIDGGECCQEVLALVTTINETAMNDLSVDQETLSIVEQILECSCVCTQINQAAINAGGGTFTITKSGDHCVTENVIGRIAVNADCVCIDLGCHTLDAGGAATAISATGREGVKIFNGCVVNSSSAGVLFTNCAAVEVSDLAMNRNALDAIRMTGTKGISVHGINSVGTVSGERILRLDSCANAVFGQSAATGYTSRIGAIVELNSCNAASVQDVDVTGNTKSAAVGGSFSQSTMFVVANACRGVDFVDVKVSNNTIATAGSDRFSAIGIMFSDSCSLLRCQANSNNVTVSVPGELYRMLFIGNSNNVIVTECQANSNTAGTVTASFRGFSPLNSSNMVFDGCQVNNNSVALVPTSSSGSLYGIFLQNSGALPVETNIIRNCQVNFNRIADGGAGRVAGGPLSYVAGIAVQRSVIVDHCQASYNSIGTTGLEQYAFGFFAEGTSSPASPSNRPVENVIVSDSSFDSNTGGELSIGMVIYAFTSAASGRDVNAFNVTISNCSASSNGSYGIFAGKLWNPSTSLLRNLTIIDCVCHRNGSATQDSAGIYVVGLGGTNTISNVLIKGCQVHETFSGVFAAGINVQNATNVVIEDTNVFDTTATGTIVAHGILFGTVSDSKIIRTQLHRNKDSGVELVGSNTIVAIIECVAMDNDKGFEFAATSTASCCLVQDCRALSNKTSGFAYAALPTPFTTTFIGNEAQCNGTGSVIANYTIALNVIPLQSLSWSTGIRINLGATTDALGAHFANQVMVP